MSSVSPSSIDIALDKHEESIGALSYGQRQLWVLEQLASGDAGYNVPSVYQIMGPLKIEALEQSLVHLMQRHQAFRTVLRTVEGQPQQVIVDTVDFHLPVLDLKHGLPERRATEARTIANHDANIPFDLTTFPLWRFKLLKLSTEEHWLLFTIHHIVFDGWSSELFANELTALYEAACQGHKCTLPETAQPQDFAQWQQQYLRGETLDSLLTYWKHKLGGSTLTPLELPTDFPRPSHPSYRGAIAAIHLPEALADRLRIVSRQKQATLFMTLLAAFKVLLFRYTAQSDIAVGTPIANRSRPEYAHVLGFLVNTLVLRTGLDGKKSFDSLLEQVRMTALEAYDHQDLPFDLLVEHLNPERDLSYNPLFQVMFQVNNRSASESSHQAQTFKLLDVETRTANFDLTLEVEETENGLIAEMEYSCDLFQPETINRMLKHYQILLEGIVANPQQPIDKLPLLTMEERHQLLKVWSRSQGSAGAVHSPHVPLSSLDLSLSLEATEDGIVGQLTHYGGRSNAGAIATMLQQFLPHLQRLAAENDYAPPDVISIESSPQTADGSHAVSNEPISNEPVSSVANEPISNGPISSVSNGPVSNEPISNGPASSVSNGPISNEPVSSFANEPISNEPISNEPISSVSNEPISNEPISSVSNGPISNGPISNGPIAPVPISQAPLSKVNVHWNNLAKPQTLPLKCLHEYFVDHVHKTPDHIALLDPNQQITYADLNAKANQVAHYLIAQGVTPDMPVGICCERSIDMIIGLLGVLKAGGAYVPLDPSYPQERLEYIMTDAQVDIVLTQGPLKSKLLGIPNHILCLDSDSTLLENPNQTEPNVAVKPEHLAYIIYTSGSTGRPKGVMIEHRAVARYVQATIAEYGITSADCILQFASISFDVAIEEIFTSLLAGARLQLRDSEMVGTPSQFVQRCQDWNITVLNLPTAYWHQLVTDIANTQLQLPLSVRLMVIGGERALPSLVKVWQQQVGDYPRLINAYGPTESTVTATGCWIDSGTEILQEVPIGKPFANTETYILDKYRQPVPIGVPGELHIGGQSLARGYLNRPGLTELKFIPHPYSRKPNAQLYKTGDRARYLADGNIEFLGRIDNQVKIRGFRIELGEVESALLDYPGVRETVVIAKEDTPGNAQLIGYIIPSTDQKVSRSDLNVFLRERLPSYMVPAMLVSLETFPLTPNGKIDVHSLPAPSSMMVDDETVYVAPRTPVEKTLATIWTEVLGLPKVSIQDSFFDLGGHSLQAIQAISQITNALEVELPISALFQAPTVEQMAQFLGESVGKAAWSPLVPLQTNGNKRPFFTIHGGHGEVLFYQELAQCLGHDQPFYALRARGNDYPDMPHRKIEDMAACYIEAMREIQPEGPYRFGGSSLGGIVAFEIAQQLQVLGQKTELLILFDTGSFEDFSWPLPLHKRLLNGLLYIPKFGIADAWKRLMLRILKLFTIDSAVEFYRATGSLPRRSSHAMRIWETVWEANLDAIEEYEPQPYDGQITLLRAIDDGSFMWNEHEPDYGWGRYTSGDVTLYDVPGNHIGMFQDPHVWELAHTMKQLLDDTPSTPSR